jgi:hypothetical protein
VNKEDQQKPFSQDDRAFGKNIANAGNITLRNNLPIIKGKVIILFS